VRAILAVIVAGVLLGLWLAFGWRKARRSRARRAEVQKLLELAAKDGTLTPAMLQAALGWDKEKAETALSGMSKDGLAQFDVDESGAPVYRVEQKALEARKHRGW
jgi:hypothetical protein